MLDLKFISANLEAVKIAMNKRRVEIDFGLLTDNDEKRKALLLNIEELRHTRNKVSEEIAGLKKSGKDAGSLIEKMKDVSETIKNLDKELAFVEAAIQDFLISLPNLPHADVPVGKDETDNRLERTWGEPKKFDFEIKPHWEIGEALGILDPARAGKLAGARFSLYFGNGARLERALYDANCAFLFEKFSGLDTKIEEEGRPLSSGEKQLVCIARAFAFDPELIIFDEATSYMDSNSEQKVHDAMKKLMKGRLSIIIAHRLSTVRDCDSILLLRDGSIREQGSHHELIALKGEYYHLLEKEKI